MRENILQVIDAELERMQQAHEEEILKYQQEVNHLKRQKKELEQFYTEKINKLSKLQIPRQQVEENKYKWLLNHIIKFDKKIQYQLKDKIDKDEGREAFLILLDLMKQSMERDELGAVNDFLKYLQMNNGLLFDEDHQDEWLGFITEILLFNFYDIDERHDVLFINVFNLLFQLRNTELHDKIKHVLETEYDELFEQVLYINMADVIVQFMRLYRLFNLNEYVYKIVHHILYTEWEFIEYSVSEKEFNSIFWYTYMLGLEKDFKAKLVESEKFLRIDNDSIAVYLYLDDCKNQPNAVDQAVYDQKLKLFLENHVLSFDEKLPIITKLNDSFNALIQAKEIEQHRFKWPTTKVSGENCVNQENGELREQSALKELGYQITGLNRKQRWQVLQQAVPELGLKRVANIIAHHVRMRKGQKNGTTKFRYAITEWEYDLDRLKKTYYKNEFTWPQY